MAKPILLISDLHLDNRRPEITDWFFDFLKEKASQAQSLYILGDLFEAWIGDDHENSHYHQIEKALRAYSQNIPVYFQHGNRDFLIRQDFAKRTGCQLLHEYVVQDFFGTPTLLLHGDTLCTDDVKYQEFRAMARNPEWQKEFLAKPFSERLQIAKQARDASRAENSEKAQYIMVANQNAVQATFDRFNLTRMIHGHTHRPAIHQHQKHNLEYTRIVLGDWDKKPSYLELRNDGLELLY